MKKLSMLVFLLLLGSLQVHAQVEISPFQTPTRRSPEEEAAARRLAEQRQKAAEAERMRIENEKKSLGLGSHRDAEAERFLEMKRQADAERNKFNTAAAAENGSKPKPAQDNGMKCEMRNVRQSGSGTAPSVAEAREKMEYSSRCGGTLGGVAAVENVHCYVWSDGVNAVWNGTKLERKKTGPVLYHCSREVKCAKEEKKCWGGGPVSASAQ